MPGQTKNYGIPYPYISETVDAGSFQAMSNAMDGVFSQVDITRQQLLHRPSVYAQNIQLETLTSGTTAILTFNNNLWSNPPSFHSTSTNTDRFVVPEAGLYLVTCNVVDYPLCTSTVTGIQLNNGTIARHSEGPNNQLSIGGGVGVTTLSVAQVGDYFSGTALFVGTGTTTVHVTMQVCKMSDF